MTELASIVISSFRFSRSSRIRRNTLVDHGKLDIIVLCHGHQTSQRSPDSAASQFIREHSLLEVAANTYFIT